MAKINEIIGSAAAIAKGMSVTFREMMQPTLTDAYPDAPPNFRSGIAGFTYCSVMRTGWKSVSPVSCAPRRAR